MLSRSLWTQILFLAVVTFLLAAPAQAEIRSATVAVDGMSCPFCAFGVEKRLKKVEGVGSVTISAKKGTATLVAKAEESIDVEQIPGAIESAGFTPGSVTVDAVGRVSTDEKDRVLSDRAWSPCCLSRKRHPQHSCVARLRMPAGRPCPERRPRRATKARRRGNEHVASCRCSREVRQSRRDRSPCERGTSWPGWRH